ncbi:hypothetical protein [Blautia sp. LMAG:75]|uniref:hypothetical protein n=1 Tax=Blautia sp. LMAG:75 TaxID=1969171 RepID=UPI0025BDEA14|nr:hypothetical protein [Blautia sp. LMAG:75]
MTFREKLQMVYPGIVKENEKIKECLGYYEFADGAECIHDCEKCWDRVIPGTDDNAMEKDDLKNGMICELRDGSLMMWLNGVLRGIDEWCGDTGNDLKDKCGEEQYDIVKVYTTHGLSLRNMLKRTHLKLIWERKETKEMTIAEIEKALGYPVKIIGDIHESNQ